MTHVVKVKQADANDGCAIFIDRLARPGAGSEDGEEVELGAGEHSLTYVLYGAGNKAEISVTGDPTPRIILPPDGKWPFKIEVSDFETSASDRIYFVIGEQS